MPRFITPHPEQIRSVLSDSYSLWGAGLSVADYIGMWEELADSRWGRRWYAWRALVDRDGRVLSSLKLYRPLLRVGDVTGRVAAIGAVFTPRPWRRCGHAATLIRATLEEAAQRGDRAALLFTDIGIEYYRALGFTPLPCEDAVGSLSAALSRQASDVTFRVMTHDDLDTVAATQAAASAARPIAIVRDRDHWQFLLDRASGFFRRLDGSDLSRRFMIASQGSRAIGYLVAVSSPGEWNLREAEAIDNDPRTRGRILAAGCADASAEGARTVWGWIPREVWPSVSAWRLRPQPRLRAIPMIRRLDDRPLPGGLDTSDGAFVPYLDQF